jgi:transposase-like protein
MDSRFMITSNYVDKECPYCKKKPCDIQAAIIVTDDKGERISFNKYKCISCHTGFLVRRKGNKKEQTLTEKYIKSNIIKF